MKDPRKMTMAELEAESLLLEIETFGRASTSTDDFLDMSMAKLRELGVEFDDD